MNKPVPSNAPAASPSGKGAQFGLLELFYATSVFAVGLLLSPWTIPLTALALVFWWLIVRGQKAVAGWGLGCIAFLGLLFCAPTSLQQVRSSGPYQSAWRMNTARHINLAIIYYEAGHMKFPPAYLLDAAGNPGLSWRVHLLPYLEHTALYNQFNLSEPWDSPNNIKLVNQMPPIYSHFSRKAPAGLTGWKLVVDKGTPFEPGRTMNYGDLHDGASNTLCLVEDAKNLVPWTKPEDLTVDAAVAVLAVDSYDDVAYASETDFGTKYGGTVVSLTDGRSHLIGPGVAPDAVRGWCLVDDGLGFEYEQRQRSHLQAAARQYYITLGSYFLLLVLPGVVLFYKRSSLAKRNID